MKHEDWIMKRIEIEFNSYGKYANKYTGVVKFVNGEDCSFVFALKPEMTAPYLHLIANEVAASANQLASKITDSLQKTKESDNVQA